jgi:hypothetical protein
VGQYSFLFLSEQLNFFIIFVPPEVPRSADFWAVPGMAQNGADFIFSGILGRSGNGAKWRGYYFFRDFGPFREWRKNVIFSGIFGPFRNGRILFFPGFWAVPGMAQNGADFIFSAHFWAVPGMAQFITFSHKTFSLPPL